MIVELLVSMILALLLALLTALPGDASNTIDIPSFGPAVAVALQLDGVLPVHEIVEFIALGLGTMTIILTMHVVNWVFNKIRGAG